MKILLVGGGTGGHFYPLIAIAEELNKIADKENILHFNLYYMSDTPYDQHALDTQFIKFIPITAGKLRVYPSFQNFLDLFRTFFGIFGALRKLFSLYPDVIISKGGYAAFPVLLAARIFRIPVIIHESDTVAGRVNKWSGKFAERVALSFPEAAVYFDESKVSVVGNPVRHMVATGATENPAKFFDMDPNIPIIGVVGGSQGAKAINSMITSILPDLVKKYQIIHQTGIDNYDDVMTEVKIILEENVYRNRYKAIPFLNELQTKMFGGACKMIISRSGSMLFEIASWGKPSIMIPYPLAHDDHQKKNAYHYARVGAAVVIEEGNMTSSVLIHEIENILDHKDHYEVMAHHAKEFYKPDAAAKIATEAIKIAMSHENK